MENGPRQNLHHVGTAGRGRIAPGGRTYDRPAIEGGGETSTYPFEDWRYRYLEGIGENVELEFVDPTMHAANTISRWTPAKRTRCSTFRARA